jgi:hypothetical protein
VTESEAVYLKKLEQVMNSPTGAVVVTIGGESMTVTEAIRSMLADGVPARGIDYTVGKALERATA